MTRILAISSQVARGAIGLSAAVPALQALGHEVIALPTILLSSHPGHTRFAGERVSPGLLSRMLDALEANGWLGEIDAVLTGYLPSPEHVAFAADAVDRVRRLKPGVLYVCDPVLGDEPKGLYIAAEAAAAIKSMLVPRANVITPNRFETGYLASRSVTSVDTALMAIAAMGHGGLAIVKSLPGTTSDELVNLACTGTEIIGTARVPRREGAQHGTGDLLAALVLAALVEQRWQASDVLTIATAVLDATLARSSGRDELDLTGLPRDLDQVVPWPVESQNASVLAGGWTIRPGTGP